MAATLTSEPSSPGYSKNHNFFTLQTDQISLTPGSVQLDISSTGPSLAQTIQIQWAGQSVTLTVEAGTNSTATAWPEKSGSETLAQYADRVFEAIRQNDLITTDFYVWRGGTVGAAERITLHQIVPGVLDITVTNGLANVAETVGAGAAPELSPNLSGLVQIWSKDVSDPNADSRITTLHGTYNVANSQVVFDLYGLFDLPAAVPSDDSITPAVYSPWPYAEAYGAFTAYYLRYADKFGTPAAAEALVKSNTFYMLRGSVPGDALPGGAIGSARLQHAYVRADGATFIKPANIDQPDWMYIWTNVALNGVRFEVAVTWDEGSTTTQDAGGYAFPIEEKKLYWFACGPRQVQLSTYPPPGLGAEPVFYRFRMYADAGEGEVLIKQITYRINCQCHPWNLYLLMDNGLAGCESVAMRGKTKTRYTADRESARILRWDTYSTETGEINTFNAEGQQIFEVNTGWQDRYYIEHLRQMLLGDLWIIDTANSRFLKVICETKEIDIHQDDQQLHSLSLTLRAAWFDNNIHL